MRFHPLVLPVTWNTYCDIVPIIQKISPYTLQSTCQDGLREFGEHPHAFLFSKQLLVQNANVFPVISAYVCNSPVNHVMLYSV